MSINGVSASTLNGDRSASADGVDDFAESTAPVGDGPEATPSSLEFGFAIVFRGTQESDFPFLFGNLESGATAFNLSDDTSVNNSNADLGIRVRDDNGNGLVVRPKNPFLDGNAHLLVYNKTGNDAATDIQVFIDDMQTPQSLNVASNSSFLPADYAPSVTFRTFDLKSPGSSNKHKDVDISLLEFNSDPYSQQDRLDLKQRAPGL
jgi:hypothetical protein